jgi:hypothetical protein
MMGTRTTDLFTGNGLEMERQAWLLNDRNTAAVRQKLINRRGDSIRLRNMVPLACRSASSLRIIKIPDPSGWNILVQKRHKNDIPESLVPKGDMSVRVDPFLVAPLGSGPNGQAMLIGYLNQNEHLAHIELSFKEYHGKTAFNALNGVCEFNDIMVPPGGEVTTQWIWMSTGQPFETAIRDYADRVGIYHNVSPPASAPPSAYCTWYYHALFYNEENLKHDLKAFR